MCSRWSNYIYWFSKFYSHVGHGYSVCRCFCCVYGDMRRYTPPLTRKTPTRNATASHEQDFVYNEALLPTFLKERSQSTLITARYSYVLGAFSLCVFLEVSVATTNNSPLVPAIVNIPRTAPHTTAPRWGQLLVFLATDRPQMQGTVLNV